MHDFPVGALVVQQEADLLFRRLEVAVAVHCVERPQRIAAKKPTEARAIDIARTDEPSGQRLLLPTERGLHPQLIDRCLRPGERLVQFRVRRLDRRLLCLAI